MMQIPPTYLYLPGDNITEEEKQYMDSKVNEYLVAFFGDWISSKSWKEEVKDILNEKS